jgi:hypothetical protein
MSNKQTNKQNDVFIPSKPTVTTNSLGHPSIRFSSDDLSSQFKQELMAKAKKRNAYTQSEFNVAAWDLRREKRNVYSSLSQEQWAAIAKEACQEYRQAKGYQ